MSDTMSTLARALKKHYLPAMTANILGFSGAYWAGEEAKREERAARVCYRRARWSKIGKRRRAAYLGWARRLRRQAAAHRETWRKREKDKTILDLAGIGFYPPSNAPSATLQYVRR